MAGLVEKTESRRDVLREAYRHFNARRIDEVLARMHPEVEWPNGWEGGYVHGHEGVRAYWTRQWAAVDPHVEPIRMREDGADGIEVDVHQVVRDLEGRVVVDTHVQHVYRFRDDLIVRMDIQ